MAYRSSVCFMTFDCCLLILFHEPVYGQFSSFPGTKASNYSENFISEYHRKKVRKSIWKPSSPVIFSCTNFLKRLSSESPLRKTNKRRNLSLCCSMSDDGNSTNNKDDSTVRCDDAIPSRLPLLYICLYW